MSSFFVVQVRTGFEIEAKEFLKAVLDKQRNQDIKSIYAMETYTQVLKDGDSVQPIQMISEKEINDYLEIRQIQSSISNLRNSLKLLKKNFNGKDSSLKMLENYHDEIRELTNKVKNYRSNSKKIYSLLKGYILIETVGDYSQLPNHLWHLIKSVPHVIGFPSRYNVPDDEIEMFFENVEFTPQIEMEFNELMMTAEEIEMLKTDLLIKVNQTPQPTNSNELYEKIDHLDDDLSNELNNLTQYLALQTNIPNTITKKLHQLLTSIKIKKRTFNRSIKEIVQLPFSVFKQIFGDPTFQCTKQQFISKLRTFVYSNLQKSTNKQVVLMNP